MLNLTLGTVDTGKSMRIIMFHHKLKTLNKTVAAFVPDISMQRDTDKEEYFIKSRASHDILPCLSMREIDNVNVDYYLIDECQFLNPDELKKIYELVHKKGKSVYAYGLKNDFKGHFFKASASLFCYADQYHEMSSLCECGGSASVSAKIGADGVIIKEGDSISPGYNFLPMCRTCWENKTHI